MTTYKATTHIWTILPIITLSFCLFVSLLFIISIITINNDDGHHHHPQERDEEKDEYVSLAHPSEGTQLRGESCTWLSTFHMCRQS